MKLATVSVTSNSERYLMMPLYGEKGSCLVTRLHVDLEEARFFWEHSVRDPPVCGSVSLGREATSSIRRQEHRAKLVYGSSLFGCLFVGLLCRPASSRFG